MQPGRVNAFNATNEVRQGNVPPSVEITSPEWFAQVDPAKSSADVSAQVSNRGGTYSCKVFVAPGSYPNNMLAPAGDFQQVSSNLCNGSARTASIAFAIDSPATKRLAPNLKPYRLANLFASGLLPKD